MSRGDARSVTFSRRPKDVNFNALNINALNEIYIYGFIYAAYYMEA